MHVTSQLFCTCAGRMAASVKTVPASYKKLVVTKLTPVFREAISTVIEPIIRPGPNQVLVKNRYVGINASDVNMAAGRYFSSGLSLPFDIGFEGVGEVADLGKGVSNLNVGQAVMYMGNKAFAEYVYLPENEVIPIPSAKPEFIPLLVSGMTAALSLDKAGQIKPGDKVLITAAAGGTGHIAVQWAKNAGCHVIGTCSTKEKSDFLKSIGCDRPINYKEEILEDVLKSEYPDGIDVVWETIGGKIFEIMLKNLAVKGRLVIVGAISSYLDKDNANDVDVKGLPFKLLLRSSSLSGFLLTHYKPDMPHYMATLVSMMHEGKLKIIVDIGAAAAEKEFKGIADISRAVEYLHSGKNKGKVVVSLL